MTAAPRRRCGEVRRYRVVLDPSVPQTDLTCLRYERIQAMQGTKKKCVRCGEAICRDTCGCNRVIPNDPPPEDLARLVGRHVLPRVAEAEAMAEVEAEQRERLARIEAGEEIYGSGEMRPAERKAAAILTPELCGCRLDARCFLQESCSHTGKKMGGRYPKNSGESRFLHHECRRKGKNFGGE